MDSFKKISNFPTFCGMPQKHTESRNRITNIFHLAILQILVLLTLKLQVPKIDEQTKIYLNLNMLTPSSGNVLNYHAASATWWTVASLAPPSVTATALRTCSATSSPAGRGGAGGGRGARGGSTTPRATRSRRQKRGPREPRERGIVPENSYVSLLWLLILQLGKIP